MVLVATSHNPSIINPEFLIQNNIIDRDRSLVKDTFSTPAFSQIIYRDGLTVRADPDRVMFSESSTVQLIDSICPKMAASYAKSLPHIPYKAVGINPKFYVNSGDATGAQILKLIDEQGSWLSFHDINPEIHLKAIYPLDSHKIVLEVVRAQENHPDREQSEGLLFRANVHHDLAESSAPLRIDRLVAILDNWKSDVGDCTALAGKITSRALRLS